MGKFKEKLNFVCTVCRGNAFCCGIIVIPPLNFSTSKKWGSPNKKDEVSRRTDWRITKDVNNDFIKLMAGNGVSEFSPSGSTANTTLVVFGRGNGSKDKMVTWCF
jgi:hypothetical protein